MRKVKIPAAMIKIARELDIKPGTLAKRVLLQWVEQQTGGKRRTDSYFTEKMQQKEIGEREISVLEAIRQAAQDEQINPEGRGECLSKDIDNNSVEVAIDYAIGRLLGNIAVKENKSELNILNELFAIDKQQSDSL